MDFRVGLGGNLYFWSKNKEELEDLCSKIDKSPKSVYWNSKYKVWVIRIKSRYHKNRFKNIK